MIKPVAVVFAVAILFASAAYATDSSIPFIKADQVHAMGYNGAGVTVAVIGTGVDVSHFGIAGRISPGGASFESPLPQSDPGLDVYSFGHETYMSLIIASPFGVAPGARILPIRVVNPLEGALESDVIQGINYVVRQRVVDPSIHVINLSLGFGQYSCQCNNDSSLTRMYEDAISAGLDNGIVTFASTGNSAECGSIASPACVSAATKVAASYDGSSSGATFGVCSDFLPSAYRVTCFSNIAEDCNNLLAAPGFDITLYEGFGQPIEFPWPGMAGHGTSQAAAHASGVAALMFSKVRCGTLGAEAARSIIFNTAETHDWAFPYCPLPPQPRHINALNAVNAVASGPCSGTPGDFNCDDVVDAYDLLYFLDCMTGPEGPPLSFFCECVDFPFSPPDGDVDLEDFAAFQWYFSGFKSGACCHADGSCTEGLVIDCLDDLSAVYQGHDTTCATVECPLPNFGACCDIATQECSESGEKDCIFGGGFYLGDGSDCTGAECPTARYQNVIEPLTSYSTAGAGLQLADDITLDGAGPYMLAYYDLGVFGGGGGAFDVTVGLYTDCPGDGGMLIPGTERTFLDNADNGSPVFLDATFNPAVAIPNQFWIVASFSNSQAGWFRAEQAEIGFTGNLFGRNDPPWVCNLWFGGSPYAGFWAGVGCVEPQGACCQVDDSCTEGSQPDCAATNGLYIGDGSTCAETNCALIEFGACCDPNTGACAEAEPTVCANSGGDYQGDGTTCAGTMCPFGQYSNEIDPAIGFTTQAGALALADDMTLQGTGARELVLYDLAVYGNGGGAFDATVALYDGCPGEGGSLISETEFTWNAIPDDGFIYTLERDLSGSPVTVPDTVWMVVQFSNADAAWVLAGTAEVGSTEDEFGVNLPPWGCGFWFEGNPYAGFWANLRCIAAAGSPAADTSGASITKRQSAGDSKSIKHRSLRAALHPVGLVDPTPRAVFEASRR